MPWKAVGWDNKKPLAPCAGNDLLVLNRQVMELARMLFEGICSKAVIQSQKEAFKGLEIQNQHAFIKPPKAPVAGKKPGFAVAFG